MTSVLFELIKPQRSTKTGQQKQGNKIAFFCKQNEYKTIHSSHVDKLNVFSPSLSSSEQKSGKRQKTKQKKVSYEGQETKPRVHCWHKNINSAKTYLPDSNASSSAQTYTQRRHLI